MLNVYEVFVLFCFEKKKYIYIYLCIYTVAYDAFYSTFPNTGKHRVFIFTTFREIITKIGNKYKFEFEFQIDIDIDKLR